MESSPRYCPLCGCTMAKGEQVKSVVYPGSPGTPDKITEIYGCPHCFPGGSEWVRKCPVCKKELGQQDFVLARMFDRKPKIHVHVLGCTICYKKH